MIKLDLRELVRRIKDTVESHMLDSEGKYARWLWQNDNGDRRLGVNEYGCADAANILYTINDFYCSPKVREARIRELASLQDDKTGLFYEETHHPIHTTAHCTAALRLFGERPLYPLNGLRKYLDRENLYALLDGLDWKGDPWPQSHQGAGVYSALANAGEDTYEFQKSYFEWFYDNADPETGFWKKGVADKAQCSEKRSVGGQASLYCYMAAGFHYLFNHEYAKMPLRYPEKVVDSCIKMYTQNGLPDNFAKGVGFLEIDWLYCLNRAKRQTAHRFEEIKALIRDFGEKYVEYLYSLEYRRHDGFNDLHMLFGAVCALAELQTALPGEVITERPLCLVLDARPFI